MPKYLWRVGYTTDGAGGLLAEGGSARRDAIRTAIESVGGTMESCHFAFGGDDLYVIGEVPDEVAAASMSIRTAAAGAARTNTVALLTPEQIDEAVKRPADYRPPGR
ncbi:GYD domain-containing protein [Rhodococcus sp. NPDC003348]